METDKDLSPPGEENVQVKLELDEAWPMVSQQTDEEQKEDDKIENMIANMTDDIDNDNSGSGDSKPSGSGDWTVATKRKHFDSSDSELDISMDIYNVPVNWNLVKIREFIQEQCGPVRKVTLRIGKGSEPNYVNVVLESSSQLHSALKTLNSIRLDGKQLNAVSKCDEGERPNSTTPSSRFSKTKRHNDLSRPPPGPQARLTADNLWLELTDLLNSVKGGVQRPLDKWKKISADWKSKTKKKALAIGRENQNGDEPPQNFNALERRVLALMINGNEALLEDRPLVLPVEPVASESPPAARSSSPINEYQVENEEQPVICKLEQPSSTDPLYLIKEECVERVSSPVSPTPKPHTSRPFKVRRRRRRIVTPFDKATENYLSIEEQRLRLEDERDKRLHARELERERLLHQRELEREKMLHEREMERLRIEGLKLKVETRQNTLLQSLLDFLQRK